MGAYKLRGCPLHDRFVQVPGIKPGTVNIKGILQARIVNLVCVLLPGTRANCIESIVHFESHGYHNVTGKVRIQSIRKPLHRKGGTGAKIGHIAAGVHPRIRAAASGHMDRVPHHGCGSLFHGLCHSGQVLLHLPAVVSGSKIGQKQRNIPHKAPHRPKDASTQTNTSTPAQLAKA